MIFRKIILGIVCVHILSTYWNTRQRQRANIQKEDSLVGGSCEVEQVPGDRHVRDDESLQNNRNSKNIILKFLFVLAVFIGIVIL